MKTRECLVVIGNGMAGVATVEEVLRRGGDFKITIFGSEPHVNYNRVLLSSFLAGEIGMEEMVLNRREWYERNGIDLRCGVTAARIDIHKKEVVTGGGDPHPFDKLLIATGSNPFIPPIKGVPGDGTLPPGVFTFRNIADTEGMVRWARESRKAFAIGGGLLGIEAAFGLIRHGVDVTIVHLVDRLMEMQLDPTGSEILRRELVKMGVQVLLEHCTEELIFEEGRLKGIYFKNGNAYEADMAVIATGIRPNAAVAREAGLAVNRGIVVSDYMQTTHPDIYAVGVGVQDSISLGIEMERRFQGIPCPGKLKMAVSGCPRNCAESGIKDIGIVGIQTGWEIYVGGNGGVKVRSADLLTTVRTREEVLDLAGLFIQYYRENARWLERTSHFIERVGIHNVREVLLEGDSSFVDSLKERMEEAVAAYSDPWAESLDKGEEFGGVLMARRRDECSIEP